MGVIWDFKRFAGLPALISDTGTAITYGELEALSENAEAAIDKAADPGPGAKPLTMLICSNTMGSLSGYAALINRGCPILPVSAELEADKRKALMNTYRPGLLLLPKELRGGFPAMKELFEFGDYILLKTNYRECFPVHPQLAQMIPTSGSTGSAKFVRQSRENLRFNAAAHAEAFRLSTADKTVTALPMQYTYGLSIYHTNLLEGAAMVVTKNSVMDSEFWDLVEAEEVSCFHGVPNTYDLLQRIGLFEDDFPSLRLLSQAGGKLSRELQEYYGRYAAENGKRFIIMYGQSEATAAISWLPAEEALKKPVSVGRVIPGGSVTLIDMDGNPVEGAHRQGELVYRGPNVAMGYAQCGDDLARGDEWNGVLRTGDIAELDEDSFIFITGRLKRFIKLAGHRVSLDEVDGMIMDELNIFSVSIGRDDHLTVFVTGENEKDMVAAFVPKVLSAARANLRVLTVPAIPRNEGGKPRCRRPRCSLS